ncbi:MAG: tryptophan--tRNA ligase [Candidatus Daviesbacteria bacterium]|nr:tryptophan--tRNA ligase [Candidatus Daviesbacteria bacterium]
MEDQQKVNLEQIAQQDYEAKTAHWAEKANYYPEKLDELGLKSIDRFVQYHPDPSRLMRMGITFGHRDLEAVAEVMANNKPWAVVSGLNPSGPLHFGHKQVFDELLWLQQQGAELYMPITNDETYIVDKAKSLSESRKTAYEKVIPSIIAMGFKPDRTHIFVDSDYLDIYNVAMDLSKHLNLNRIFGVFGFGKDEEGENPGTIFYRGAVQLAQILLPQLEEFGGPKPTLVPVGVDQYPYILLARDIAKKKGLIPPSAIFTKFTHGLDGKGKMSSTRPASSIFLTDELNVAQSRIKGAYTGGSVLASFQRENGGVPGVCPIYTLRTYHFEDDNKVWDQCSSGQILCGECKKTATEDTVNYLINHRERLIDARKRIDEFILKTPIRSIFK